MFSKIFPKIHVEGYKFLVISGIITIVFYIFMLLIEFRDFIYILMENYQIEEYV